MSTKNSRPAFSLIVAALLVSCSLPPSVPAVTPSPTFASSGPLSATFTRSTYRLGDTLEFTVRLENNGTTPVTIPLTLTLEGTYDPGIMVAQKFYPLLIWSKTQDETLGLGEKRTLTYPIPFDLYRAIGTGNYELKVEALGASLRVETVVLTVFDVQVTYPKDAQAGQTISIPAIITNTASFDAHDVEVHGSGVASEESFGTFPARSSKTVIFTENIHNSNSYQYLRQLWASGWL